MEKEVGKWEVSVSVHVGRTGGEKREHVFSTTMYPPTKKTALQIAHAYRSLLETVSEIFMLVANHIFGVE